MKKPYVWDVMTALALLATIETFFWTQSRTGSDNDAVKVLLVSSYLTIAVASQGAICLVLRSGLLTVVKSNVMLAAIMSVGLAVLAFTTHPAVLKDAPTDWRGAVAASSKFFFTVGVVTMVVRTATAAICTCVSAQRRISKRSGGDSGAG